MILRTGISLVPIKCGRNLTLTAFENIPIIVQQSRRVTILLTDVFENIRDILDPAWYYTAPGLAMISKRYGKAKNKYTNDKFNSSKSSKYIQ